MSTMEGADEAAIEDILSTSSVSSLPSIMSGSTDSTYRTSRAGERAGVVDDDDDDVSDGSSDTGVSVSSSNGHKAKGFNLSLTFALQRKRAMRAVRKLARHVKLPLPPVSCKCT